MTGLSHHRLAAALHQREGNLFAGSADVLRVALALVLVLFLAADEGRVADDGAVVVVAAGVVGVAVASGFDGEGFIQELGRWIAGLRSPTRASAASPSARAIGTIPAIIAALVISTGRIRIVDPPWVGRSDTSDTSKPRSSAASMAA